MRVLVAAVLLAGISAASAQAAGTVAYGSRAGMEVTVVRMEGIGSADAVIHVKHTPANARAFCVEYSNDRTRKCVETTLRETRLSDALRGNCKTGRFTTLYGASLQFKGIKKKRDELDPKYVIIGDEGPLDGSSASGYPTALAQFQALCPALVDDME